MKFWAGEVLSGKIYFRPLVAQTAVHSSAMILSLLNQWGLPVGFLLLRYSV